MFGRLPSPFPLFVAVMTTLPRVTVVIPLLNEQPSLRPLHEAIVRSLSGAVAEGLASDFEILFVDDGSKDGSWQAIEELSREHANTRGIRLRRNFGKAAALATGFETVTTELIITMDADLQDDPKEIPRFLEQIRSGFDVVSGWKQVRNDPWHKTMPSAVFNFLVSKLTGVVLHDHNCGFKAYRREIFDEVKLYGEMHRFVPVLAAARGWKVTEIVVEHHARPFGYSKYGVSRIIKGFLDLLTIYFLTGFAQRPLHLIGSAGLLCFSVGALGLGYLTVAWIVTRLFEGLDAVHLHEKALFYYCIVAVLLGAQWLAAGLLAELITSIARRQVPPASIAQTTGGLASTTSSD
jgi:glycosyltransferase involved in cell wall biosynthesis